MNSKKLLPEKKFQPKNLFFPKKLLNFFSQNIVIDVSISSCLPKWYADIRPSHFQPKNLTHSLNPRNISTPISPNTIWKHQPSHSQPINLGPLDPCEHNSTNVRMSDIKDLPSERYADASKPFLKPLRSSPFNTKLVLNLPGHFVH